MPALNRTAKRCEIGSRRPPIAGLWRCSQRFLGVRHWLSERREDVLLGIIQGFLGGLTFWIFGVGSPILWGVVMALLSVIPLVGSWLVLYPAAIIQLIVGNIFSGIGIILIAAIIISNVDTVLRPRLVGRDTGMHDLMIFFSTLGGISLFGIMGFIIGPVIAVFFLTILDIYAVEFKTTLDMAQSSDLVTSKQKPTEA